MLSILLFSVHIKNRFYLKPPTPPVYSPLFPHTAYRCWLLSITRSTASTLTSPRRRSPNSEISTWRHSSSNLSVATKYTIPVLFTVLFNHSLSAIFGLDFPLYSSFPTAHGPLYSCPTSLWCNNDYLIFPYTIAVPAIPVCNLNCFNHLFLPSLFWNHTWLPDTHPLPAQLRADLSFTWLYCCASDFSPCPLVTLEWGSQ